MQLKDSIEQNTAMIQNNKYLSFNRLRSYLIELNETKMQNFTIFLHLLCFVVVIIIVQNLDLFMGSVFIYLCIFTNSAHTHSRFAY